MEGSWIGKVNIVKIIYRFDVILIPVPTEYLADSKFIGQMN
jgi:hypothetical protein